MADTPPARAWHPRLGVLRHVHLPHAGALNDKIAVKLTTVVGSMWCAYAFALLALVSLPDAIKAGKPAIISWIAQTFLQLVLLSIIMVGTNLLGATAEKRDIETHDAVMAELELLRESHEELHAKIDAQVS